MLVAELDIVGIHERRGALRFVVDAPTTLRGPDAAPIDVVIADFSRKGFLMVTDAVLDVGMQVSVGLSGSGSREAIVVRRDPRGYGCQFVAPLTRTEMATAFANRDGAVAPLPSADERRAKAEAEEQRAWYFWTSVAYGLAVATLVVVGAAWFLLLR